MLKEQLVKLQSLMHGATKTLYHVVVVALSAGIAISLPTAAGSFLTFWSRVEHEKVYLVAFEIVMAVCLILCINYIHRSLQDRTLAKMATGAGLSFFFPRRGLSAQRKIKKLKEKHGIGRTIMVIGSTGYGTFVDPEGDLHVVLQKCLGAQILLVNPYSKGAASRIHAILHPHFTLKMFREEVRESIALLKRVRATGKPVKLKLYSDQPLVKLSILGDHLWLKHYHTDLDVQTMPGYVFQHNLNDHGLYNLFYQYFVQRWESPEIPEYDFDTGELIYRGDNGADVVKRERFDLDASVDLNEGQISSDDFQLSAPSGRSAARHVSLLPET